MKKRGFKRFLVDEEGVKNKVFVTSVTKKYKKCYKIRRSLIFGEIILAFDSKLFIFIREYIMCERTMDSSEGIDCTDGTGSSGIMTKTCNNISAALYPNGGIYEKVVLTGNGPTDYEIVAANLASRRGGDYTFRP